MGNEASTPQHNGTHDEGLEPPSQIPPSEATEPSHHRSIKAIFQRGGKVEDGHDSARAVAENGHMPFGSTSAASLSLSAQQLQAHQYQANNVRSPEMQYINSQIPPQHQAYDPRQLSNQQQLMYQNSQAAGGLSSSFSSTSGPVDVNKQPHPIVGVMYSSEGGSSTNRSAGSSFRNGGKVVREGGRKVINSLKNLSIGQRGSNKKGSQKEENEWETRWDEDDDESDEEDENFKIGPVSDGATLRAVMEGGQSNLSPMTTVEPVLPVSSSGTISNAILLSSPPRTHAEMPIIEGDGLVWDTSTGMDNKPMPIELTYEPPNIQMFLPLLRVLGKGSFGKVVLCQKRMGKERGALFAMKILNKQHLVKRRQIERTRTERKVLSVVDHPFIMKLHYAFQTEEKLYLVLDYCPGGELFFHLSRFRRFPERVSRFYAAELLLAIGHLHKRGIIYRDLKPENVLLDADGHVKLGDFGLAKAGIRHPCEGAISMCGTPEYMAPEVLNQSGHGFCVDYWGLGMLVYEMMTGLPPWYTTDRAKLFRRLKSAPLDIPTYFSSHSANCVTQLLERDPRRRLGFSGIRMAMENEFFRSINWRALYARRVEAPIRPCEGWVAPEGESGTGLVVDPLMGGTSSCIAEQMGDKDLDAATANFDNTFTRMPVDTEDNSNDAAHDEAAMEELHANTFVGFTFDEEDKDGGESSGLRPKTQATQSTNQTAPNLPPPII